MRLKVLPLDGWMLWDEYNEERVPIPNFDTRNDPNARYCLGDVAWFIVDGMAYEDEAKDFKYALALESATIYRQTEYAALCLLRANKRLSKDMLEKLHMFEYWTELRVTARLTRLYGIKIWNKDIGRIK